MPQRWWFGLAASLCAGLVACKRAEPVPRGAAPAPPLESALAPGPGSVPASGVDASGAALKASDQIESSKGTITLTPVHHAAFHLQIGDKTIWLDPTSQTQKSEPKADLILVTDIHADHLDVPAIERVKKGDTRIIGPRAVADAVRGKNLEVLVLANGETKDLGFVRVEAVPMYNLARGPAPGKFFHDKGRGNGYVLTLGERRLYVSGDTECTPEMKALKNIDAAVLCMNVPYTMPPAEAGACARAFSPKIVYPYHHRGSNLDELDASLAGSDVQVKRLAWY